MKYNNKSLIWGIGHLIKPRQNQHIESNVAFVVPFNILLTPSTIDSGLLVMRQHCRHLMLVLESSSGNSMCFLFKRSNRCWFNQCVNPCLHLDLICSLAISISLFLWEVVLSYERLILKSFLLVLFLLGLFWGFAKGFLIIGIWHDVVFCWLT